MHVTDFTDNNITTEYAKLPLVHELITYPAFFSGLQPQEDQVILDAGCGPGHLTKRIAEHGSRVIGIDISMAMLRYALNHSHVPFKTQYHLGDISEMSTVKDDSIDGAVMNMVPINIADRDIVYSTFRQLARVLKPGTPLLFTDLAISFWETEVVAAQGLSLVDGEVYRFDLPLRDGEVIPLGNAFWSRETYVDALSQAGLEFKKVEDLLPSPNATKELGKYLKTQRYCMFTAQKP